MSDKKIKDYSFNQTDPSEKINNPNQIPEIKTHFHPLQKGLIHISSLTPKFNTIYNKYINTQSNIVYPNIRTLLGNYQAEKIKKLSQKESIHEEIGEQIKKNRILHDILKVKKTKTINKNYFSEERNKTKSLKENRINLLDSWRDFALSGQLTSRKKWKNIDNIYLLKSLDPFNMFKNNNMKNKNKKTITNKSSIKNKIVNNQIKIVDNSNNNSKNIKNNNKNNKNDNNYNNNDKNKNNSNNNNINKSNDNNDNNGNINNNDNKNSTNIKKKISEIEILNNMSVDYIKRSKLINYLNEQEKMERESKKKNVIKIKNVWKYGHMKINVFCDSLNDDTEKVKTEGKLSLDKFNQTWNRYRKLQEFKFPETQNND